MLITDIQEGDSKTFATVDGIEREFDGQCSEEYEGYKCACCGQSNAYSGEDMVRGICISLEPSTMFLCSDCLKPKH